jgi:hypothetical protein
MVSDVGAWAWSSYPAMLGQVVPPVWLQTDWLLGQFGRQRNLAIAGYINFVRAGVGLPSVWDNLQGQIYLGSEKFIEQMQSSLVLDQAMDEIPRIQRRPLAKPLMQYLTEYADVPRTGMAQAYLSGDYAMKAIAEAFGVHYATVSRAVKAYENARESK